MRKVLMFIVTFGFAITLSACETADLNKIIDTLGNYEPIVVDDKTDTTTDPNIEVTQETLPIFTIDDLSQYTGANDSTAYIAVDGVVYDVTNTFTNGQHQGIQLGGTDATTVFASSPHSVSLIASLPIVGSLEGYEPIIVDSTPSSTTTPNMGYDDDDDDDEHEHEDEYDDYDEHEDEYDDEHEDEYDDDEYDD